MPAPARHFLSDSVARRQCGVAEVEASRRKETGSVEAMAWSQVSAQRKNDFPAWGDLCPEVSKILRDRRFY
jgi:hypothetical protein